MKIGRSVGGRIIKFVRAFRDNRRGATAVTFALCLVPMAVTVFGMIDVSRASTEKMHLQDALDAAALAAARSPAITDTALQAVGSQVLAADLIGSKSTLKSSSFKIVGNKVVASASATMTPVIAKLWLNGDMEMGASTEVVRASQNVEVALVLDVTGSMGGTKITDLKSAAKELVDLIVKDVQTPYYTKVALVPYSMGVNVTATYATTVRGAYTNGTCTTAGCQKYTFTSASGSSKTNTISNCVSERTGTQAYTDAAPATALVGRNYPNTGNPCLSSAIVPLSSSRTSLKASIDTYSAQGSTAGQIGLAWGWYMVSPTFGSIWPTGSKPAAYGEKDLVKVVVLMTDGEFNTTYCKGVISKDAGNGSGDNSDHINCNATNGGAFAQAKALCDAMKLKGITIYTVGFDLDDNSAAEDIMEECASDKAHLFLPDSGADLKSAFRAIGQDINALRLSS